MNEFLEKYAKRKAKLPNDELSVVRRCACCDKTENELEPFDKKYVDGSEVFLTRVHRYGTFRNFGYPHLLRSCAHL